MLSTAAENDRRDARWRDAILAIVGLWLIVLVIYLPIIINNHHGEGTVSVLLDCATIPVSMLLAVPLFVVFRATLGLPPVLRGVLLMAELMLIVVGQLAFDLVYTHFVITHASLTWSAVPHDLAHSYDRGFRYAAVFAINLALFQLAYSRRRSRRQERQLASLVAASRQAEIDALLAKLSPHFLFNTLNVISGLVVTRRNREADDLLGRLSTFLRASLGQDAYRFGAVDSELSLVEDYLEIESARFGERLVPRVGCEPEAASLPMPKLLLQPLIDITVRDGVDTVTDPVTVTVNAAIEGDAWLRLAVSDDARIAGRRVDPAEAVLATIHQRLDALFGGRASLDVHANGQGFLATMRLPLDALRRELV
ncbi:sensor histidine kinase [Sphingomonas oryzagri]|nr:histidine kinase [Sphingomonas oryzagri]